MKPFIVVADGMHKELFADLCQIEGLNVHPEPKLNQEQLAELLPQIEGLVIRSATKVTPELIAKAPKLKYVIRAGEGTDNIDKICCGEKNIKVSNTPGANNNSAAEHAIALMMTVLRKTAWAHQSMSQGAWDKSKYTGNELSNKTIGIVGFGRIGQIVAKRLAGFDPKVIFFDPFINASEIPYAQAAKDLNEVFEKSDIITIHTPLMDATKGLVSRDLMESMRPGSILVNAARGGIVDEEALLDTLSQNKIRGAGFDVFATEPLEADSPLRQLENLVLTPHLGASTQEAQFRVGEMVNHQLTEFFVNNNLLNEVKI